MRLPIATIDERLVALGTLMLMAISGCQSAIAPSGGLAIHFKSPPVGQAVKGEAGHLGTLRLVAQTDPHRQLEALPTAWDQAVVKFQSPTALTAPSLFTIPRAQFNFVGPYFQFMGSNVSSPVLNVLRPSLDYTVSAELESATVPVTLEAYGVVPGLQNIVAGANTFALTLATTGVQGPETAIDTTASAAAAPAVAWDSANNEYLGVWTNGGDVLARRFSPAGAALGAANVALNTVAGTASVPVVAYSLSAGKYLVAWQDSRNGHSDIYARSVSPTDVLGVEAAVTHTAGHTANETAPAIAAGSGANRFLIAWTDDRNLGTGGLDVYANRVDANVAKSGEIAVATSGTVTNQTNPTVAYAANVDDFFVVFQDSASGTAALRYQRIVASSGAIQDGALGAALTGGVGARDQATATYNSADGLLLTAWRDARSGAQTDIYYNIFNPLTATFAQADTSLFASAANKNLPKAVFESVHNDYLVMFSDDRAAGNLDVYSRRLERDGVTPHGEKAIKVLGGAKRPGGLAYGLTSDICFGVWADDRAGGASTHIYGQALR